MTIRSYLGLSLWMGCTAPSGKADPSLAPTPLGETTSGTTGGSTNDTAPPHTGTTEGTTTPHTGTTQPPDDTADPPPPPAPVRVAVVSDLNDSYGSTTYSSDVHAAVRAILADPPDIVLIPGDMVAGQQHGLDYAAMWAGFHAAVTIPLEDAGIVVLPSPGNHDASGYSGYEDERAAYATAWAGHRPPLEVVDDSDWPFRHAYRLRGVLFVSLDDTLVGTLASEQRSWVDGILDDDSDARIVFGHVPLYPVAIGRETEVLNDASLEAVFNDHNVDLFVSGHHHAWYPGRRGDLRMAAMACLGSGARALVGTSTTSPKSYARFTIDADGLRDLDAYGGSSFTTRIERSSLPTRLVYGSSWIDRDDQ